jgi:NADPH:quinone reductase-like Zn-dependent oxidoreductase
VFPSFFHLVHTDHLCYNVDTMKAVIIKERGVAALADIKEQTMRPDYIKIKTVAVAINPTDISHTFTANVGRIGGILGCDVSGIVEEIGKQCKSDIKKGDKVYGVCHGANLVSRLLIPESR